MIDSLLSQLQQITYPGHTLRPGKVLTNHRDGSCTIELDEGGLILASGDYPENSLVFIKGTVIDSEAADLPFIRMEV